MSEGVHPLAHLQVGFERGDDFSDPLDNCPQHWENCWLTAGKGGVIERYRDGDFALHIHFRIWPNSLQDHPDEFCAVYRAAETPFLVPDSSDISYDPESYAAWLRLSRLPGNGSVEQSVFVRVRQTAQIGKKEPRVAIGRIGSVVGLQRLDECAVFRKEISDHVLARLAVELSFAQRDRELGPGGWFVGVEQGQLPREMVKRTAEVVDDVSCDHAEVGGRLRNSSSDHVFGGLRVELMDGLIRLFGEVGDYGRLQLTDDALCAFDLETCTSERVTTLSGHG